MHDTSQAVK